MIAKLAAIALALVLSGCATTQRNPPRRPIPSYSHVPPHKVGDMPAYPPLD